VAAAAKDLAQNKGKALVMVGENQPAAVHALALAINVALGALDGGAMSLTTGAPFGELGIEALTEALSGGSVDTLFVLDGNPVYSAPGKLGFAAAMAKAKTVVHVGVLPDETAAKATWHLPSAHFLEAWGDAAAWSGAASIIQPLILPLHGARATISLIAQVAGEPNLNDKALVEATWRGEGRPSGGGGGRAGRGPDRRGPGQGRGEGPVADGAGAGDAARAPQGRSAEQRVLADGAARQHVQAVLGQRHPDGAEPGQRARDQEPRRP
jgi:molybdopterin-containing oxidoreductase family iron-sulfur binding subunit